MIKSITFIAHQLMSSSNGDAVLITALNVDKKSLKENIKDHLLDMFTLDELKAIIGEVEND